jgi:ABC-2 type transport system permease protein
METILPKKSTVLTALFRADILTQWRNRRAVVLSLLIPIVLLILWKVLIAKIGGPAVMASSLSYGLTAIGLLGYATTISRDRDKGIFQRLRVAPLPTWAIMCSRLLVQLLMIVIVTTAIFIVGCQYDNIVLTPVGYVITYFTAIIGCAVYLSIGQLIVGLIKNPETVNTTARLVFVAFVMIGITSSFNAFGQEVAQIAKWAPYGVVNTIMAAGMAPTAWTMDTTYALFATLGYTVIFATIGIKNFKWNTK